MDQEKWYLLHKAPFCPHRQMNFSRGKIHLGNAILFGGSGKICHQGHGGIIWEFMEQHK